MKTIPAFILFVITCSGYAQPGISVNPAALDFDTTLVNQSSTLQTVVKNTGTGVLTVTDITSSNPVFIATPDSFTLVSNQEQVVDVTFIPDEAKSFYGTLDVLNDSPTPSVEVICTGAGKWPLGINPLNRVRKPFTLYPNPVNDQLNLIINLKKATHISIVISDMTGKKRADRKIGILEPGDQALNLSGLVQHLPSGIYLLHIRIGETWYLEKLIKL
ncbi:MAG: T9SS type A sorting domain-containing protein [Bacteroidales bacterium]|nr:T9SS type A sorting domain-containing protein [Bacteroidota bacterium]MBL6949280.1 T9SS type A sorting domain-containing protein [Bacteroidales bacterium]